MPLSYSQRGEDIRLANCFAGRADGFYIDVGANDPVYDSVSFMLYQHGWRGMLVEPHPDMAARCRAVRPRDIVIEALAGAAPGEATFHIVQELHGFSTAIAGNADAARSAFGAGSAGLTRPVVTLAALCERHAPPQIDVLSIDVEGYEAEVLRGADFGRFRPRVVLVEALAPYTLEPTWPSWEALLLGQGYRYASFDGLNRYYVAEEAADLLAPLRDFTDPPGLVLFGNYGRPLEDASHPDAVLARRLARETMTRLPLSERGVLLELAIARMGAADLDQAATRESAAAAWEAVFGTRPQADELASIHREGCTLRDVYARIVDGDAFRAACGRIAASSAW